MLQSKSFVKKTKKGKVLKVRCRAEVLRMATGAHA